MTPKITAAATGAETEVSTETGSTVETVAVARKTQEAATRK